MAHLILALLMTYTFFFLLGIPFWLIASARVLRSDSVPSARQGNRPWRQLAWAGLAFFAPLALLGLSSVAHLLMERQFGDTATWTRGVGYFLVLVNLFAFFSPFLVSALYKSRYGVPSRQTVLA